MYMDFSILPNAVRPVGCLILDSWVPPAVEMDNMSGPRKGFSSSTCLDRANEYRGAGLTLKTRVHFVAILQGHRTMQKQYLFLTEVVAQMLIQQLTHFLILSENQRSL